MAPGVLNPKGYYVTESHEDVRLLKKSFKKLMRKQVALGSNKCLVLLAIHLEDAEAVAVNCCYGISHQPLMTFNNRSVFLLHLQGSWTGLGRSQLCLLKHL
jgi:hypothetical protein